MSFQAPLFLLGLVGRSRSRCWRCGAARRRPAKYVIRFPAAATLAAVVAQHRPRAQASSRPRC